MNELTSNSSLNNTFYGSCPPGSLLDEPAIRWTFITIYLLVFICCLFGNFLILLVIGVHRAMRSATNFFLANLALADLLVAIFCVLQNMCQILLFYSGYWPLGAFMCHVYVFILQMVPCTSAGILVLVSVEKYIAVLHPLFARKVLTKKLRIGLTVSVWLISIFASIPYYSAAKYIEYKTIAVCGREMLSLPFQTGSFVFWYCTPVASLAFLYARIGCVLWKSANSGILASSQVSRNARSRESSNRRSKLAKQTSDYTEMNTVKESTDRAVNVPTTSAIPDVLESRRRVIRLLIAVVLSFSILTLPHHTRLLWLVWLPDTYTHCNSSLIVFFQPFAYLLLFANSGINPFLYAFFSERFRESTNDLIHCDTDIHSRRRTLMKTMVTTDVGNDAITSSIGRRRAQTYV